LWLSKPSSSVSSWFSVCSRSSLPTPRSFMSLDMRSGVGGGVRGSCAAQLAGSGCLGVGGLQVGAQGLLAAAGALLPPCTLLGARAVCHGKHLSLPAYPPPSLSRSAPNPLQAHQLSTHPPQAVPAA
jgi:hypothetical protein